MSLLNDLLAEHGSELTGALTSQLGLNEEQAGGALASIAPMVLNGLKSQQDAGGSDAVSGLLSQLGGSEDLLGNLGNLSGLLGGGGDNPLGALLGASKGEEATNAIGQNLGIDGGKAGSVVSMLVPIVLGFISKQGRKDAATPDTQSGISAILDRDGDGSALDDIAGMILKSQGGGSGGGILGSVLGMLGKK